MAAAITVYDSFLEYAMDGTINVRSDTFRVTLHDSSYAPSSITHSILTDTAGELATANGYTVGGVNLINVAWTRISPKMKFSADATTWTPSGGSITFRHGVLSMLGTRNGITNPLVAYILGDTQETDVITPAGQVLAFNWNAAGIFELVKQQI